MDMIGIFTPTNLGVSIEITKLITLHYIRYSKDFLFTGEKHDFWEAVYVDKGETGVLAEGNGIDLHEGEAVFHKPNEYHNIWAKNQYANVVIITFVSPSPAMSFFENKIITFGDGERNLLAKILSAGKECFAGALDEVYQTRMEVSEGIPFAGLQTVKNYLELLLISLIRKGTNFSQQNRATEVAKWQGENTIVGSIKQMLADSVYGSVTLEDIVSRVCFSKSYITSLFRKHTGASVMECYTDLKIAEAQKMISERELSFGAIADRLGFNSIHYFCRVFKSKTHMTPSQYRKSVQARSVL